jgi:hypothetical protein
MEVIKRKFALAEILLSHNGIELFPSSSPKTQHREFGKRSVLGRLSGMPKGRRWEWITTWTQSGF